MENEERRIVRQSKSRKYKDISIGILCNVLTFILILIIVGAFINVYKLSQLY